ncbi:MAG: IS1634 family transposase, partial [Candidatus Ratteibacteria bacterium]
GFTLEKEETLSLYRRKDLVEKFFDTLKNELKDKRLRIHSQEVLEGRLFVSFLSLILYSALTRTMREKEFFKDYTAPELLSELKKIKMVEMENGRVYFTEVSKKQRDIFQKFGLTIPVAT